MSKDIDRRLDHLEASQATAVDRLYDAYGELYRLALGDEFDVSRRFVVKTAMKWVLCAFTQMTLSLLRHVVSTSADGTQDEELTEEDILEYCSNFIIKVSGNRVKLAQ